MSEALKNAMFKVELANGHEVLGAQLGEDADEPHPGAAWRQGPSRDQPVRSHPGSHHLPLQVRLSPRASTFCRGRRPSRRDLVVGRLVLRGQQPVGRGQRSRRPDGLLVHRGQMAVGDGCVDGERGRTERADHGGRVGGRPDQLDRDGADSVAACGTAGLPVRPAGSTSRAGRRRAGASAGWPSPGRPSAGGQRRPRRRRRRRQSLPAASPNWCRRTPEALLGDAASGRRPAGACSHQPPDWLDDHAASSSPGSSWRRLVLDQLVVAQAERHLQLVGRRGRRGCCAPAAPCPPPGASRPRSPPPARRPCPGRPADGTSPSRSGRSARPGPGPGPRPPGSTTGRRGRRGWRR